MDVWGDVGGFRRETLSEIKGRAVCCLFLDHYNPESPISFSGVKRMFRSLQVTGRMKRYHNEVESGEINYILRDEILERCASLLLLKVEF